MKTPEQITASLTSIANRHLGIKTLEEQRLNSLNFVNVYIPDLKVALEQAYSQGVIDAKAVVLETISELKIDMGL